MLTTPDLGVIFSGRGSAGRSYANTIIKKLVQRVKASIWP